MLGHLKTVLAVTKKINNDHAEKIELVNEPYETLLQMIVDKYNNMKSAGYSASLRSPDTEIESLSLPEEIKELYRISDGIQIDIGYEKGLFQANQIKLGGDLEPSLSALLKTCLQEEEMDEDEVPVLNFAGASLIGKLAIDAQDFSLPREFFDQQLVLYLDSGDEVLVFVCAPNSDTDYGNLLLVESGSATRFPSLKHYIADDAHSFDF